MSWSLVSVGAICASGVGFLLWRFAYQLGFQRGQTSAVPFTLVDELLDHRIACLGQDPSEARVEVETELGVEA